MKLQYSNLAIDLVQNIIESSGSIFHSVNSEDFQGIHAIIEIVVDELPINQTFGIHIISSEDCSFEKQDLYKISCTKYGNYFRDYSIPVILVVVDTQIKEAYWMNFDSTLINDVFEVPATAETQLNIATFNTSVVAYFVACKQRLLTVESFLKENDKDPLKTLLEAIFGILEISIQYIFKYEYLDDLIEASGFKFEVSEKTIMDLAKDITPNRAGSIDANDAYRYYIIKHTESDKTIYFGLNMIHYVGTRYEEVRKLCI